MRWTLGRAATLIVCLALAPAGYASAQKDVYQVGVARIDVTPDGPVRLSGFAARSGESDGVDQKLWAKALAISSTTNDDVTVLVTLDATAIAAKWVDDVAEALRGSGVVRDRFALCVTHTHSAPWVSGTIPNLFGKEVPADQVEHVERYTGQLKEKVITVVRDALAHRKPAKLAWGEGKVGFAANRRPQGGPIDYAVPLLRVTDVKDGKPMALFLNYACHCTTLGSDNNRISGDWAGYAAEAIEKDNPGAVAMIAIGCGADSNPTPRGTIELAQTYGKSTATEVKRLLTTELRPLTSPITPKLERINLAFDKLPSQGEWAEQAKRTDAVGFNAKKYLARLARGEKIPAELPYTIQTWTFGDQLGMVFLSGEVVVDYSIRLKNEFDPARLWVNAYSNDVPCYIPSRRILAEGGYEAGDAMVYYGLPSKFAPGVENDIVRTVHAMLPDKLRTEEQRMEFPRPKQPMEAIDRFRLRNDLKIELMAAEPLVQSPVAIDWGNDGKLWVAEMIDFPTGLHENGTPGGRVKVLQDTDGDGKYDKGTIFLDGIKCPTGIMAWHKGVIICAAPDIIYAEDTNGDGRADVRKVLFTGFSPDNEQWLVSSLTWGLDNWVYGSSSLRNDSIQIGKTDRRVELGNRDFRFNPDTLDFEPASGHSQQGRVRDDWGRWFGNDNSDLIFQIPLADHYARRNPHIAPPASAVNLPSGKDPNRLFPGSRTLRRFNDPASANRVTSACGLGIYRDVLLGEEFSCNSFTCEPVHNVVRRMTLKPNGLTFNAEQAADEKDREFLSSTDNWFRPVQVRTGPDGALWVVDMYRFMIEHPRWITPERLAQLDIRAGADLGRIYRIFPKDHRPDPVRRFDDQATATVAKRLDTTNGTLRDAVHRELYQRKDAAAVPVLRDIALTSDIPAARAQALCALDSFDALAPDLIEDFLRDPSPQVRAVAVRLSEPWMELSQSLPESLEPLVNDPDIGVRYQLALSLGNWQKPEAATLLARIAAKDLGDPWMRSAVASGSVGRSVNVLTALRGVGESTAGRDDLIRNLIATAAATREGNSPNGLMLAVLPSLDVDIVPTHFQDLALLLDAWPDDILGKPIPIDPGAASRVERLMDAARKVVDDPGAAPELLTAAAPLLGRQPHSREADLKLLATLLQPQADSSVQKVAIAAMSRTGEDRAAELLLQAWPQVSPSQRDQVLDALLSRPEWAGKVLGAVKTKSISAAEIDDAHRKKILDAGGDAQTAVEILKPAPADARAKVIEHFAPSKDLKGDSKRGGVFFNKLCASCHLLNGQGHAVGPDLRAVTDKSADALLRSILDPNSVIDGKYSCYIVQTTKGESLDGLIADETATSLSLLQPNGMRREILRKDLKQVRRSKVSLMPEGLEVGLSLQDLADLMRYVQEGGTPEPK